MTTRRGLRGVAGLVGALALLGPVGAAAATPVTPSPDDDGARIVQTTRTDSGLAAVLDVPDGVEVDLEDLTATVDGEAYDARAARLSETDTERTAVVAIDTSDSMGGPRIEAAKQAATTFVDTAPDGVAVGVVTFDSEVTTALEPTTDRDTARAVIEGLTLRRGTRLYDGLVAAAELTGDTGQRSVLVLSDGADTNSELSLARTRQVLTRAGTPVDVVALEQTAAQLTSLRLLAVDGQVVASDNASLASVFSDRAAALDRQVGVSVEVPASATAGQLDLALTLPSSAGDLVAETTLLAGTTRAADPSADVVPAVAEEGFTAPGWLMMVGVGVFGLGLLLALVLLVPRKPVRMSAEQRVLTYAAATAPGGAGPDGTAGAAAPAKEDTLLAAKEAAGRVLERNQSLEARISRRLEGAGSQLKSSEWLLVHGGVFLVAGLVGLLLGGGNLVLGLLFLVLGLVGPWVYLGVRGSRRRKAFSRALPDTLQMMAGSLTAGLSLAQSVDTIVREGPEPMASEFGRVLVETRLGVSLEEAFDGVARRFESDDFGWVVMAIRIQRQVGGNLAELLETVAETIREREYMRRQVAALAAEGKLSAYVLGGLPPLLVLYMLLVQPAYISPLFTDPRGLVIFGAGTLWLLVGIFWMSKMIKVEV